MEEDIITDPYMDLTDEELDEMYESWEADSYLSSMSYYDRDYVDSGL